MRIDCSFMRLKVELMHQNTFKDNKKFVPDIFLYGFKENDPIRFMHNIAHIEVKFVCSLPTKVALSDSYNTISAISIACVQLVLEVIHRILHRKQKNRN